MEEWNKVTAQKAFITDLGPQETAQPQELLCRFAVWLPEKGEQKHRLAEVGNSLEILKQKYNVGSEYIFRVQT